MKNVKKMLSVLVALVMVLGMNTMVFAASEGMTITVNPAYSGETYTAYKVFDATYVEPLEGEETVDVSYTISSDSPWYAQVNAANSVFTLTAIPNMENTYQVTIANDDVSGADIVAALKTVPQGAEAAATVTIPEDYDPETGASVETSVNLDVSASGAGYYYVTTTMGTVVSIDSATPSVTVEDKNIPPSTRKTVDEVSEESVENHKTVNYELDIDHVAGNKKLVLHDKMDVSSEQVSYTFDYSTMVVQLIDGSQTTTMIKDTDYVVETEDLEDECDFHVVFTVYGVDYDFSSCSDEAYVEVTIKCELDALGAEFSNDEFEIPNHTFVTYGNGGRSVYAVADLYEYGFEIYKYDGSSEVPLADAHFSLSNASGQTAYFTVENQVVDGNGDTVEKHMYLLEGWGEVPAGSDYTSDLVSDSNGYILIEGLEGSVEGTTYTITETQAPDGYNLLTEFTNITITVDPEDESSFTVNGSASHVVNIENHAGSILPGTGGMGTTIFYIVGIILVCGAAVVLISRRRMHSAE